MVIHPVKDYDLICSNEATVLRCLGHQNKACVFSCSPIVYDGGFLCYRF
jgi:hypothetical protein